MGNGSYGNGSAFVAGSPQLAGGNLLYAFEAYYNDGYYDHPDNYRRFNGVLRYSKSTARSAFNVTAMGYEGRFDSTDQIPVRAIDGGIIGRFGQIDPTDAACSGVTSSRSRCPSVFLPAG